MAFTLVKVTFQSKYGPIGGPSTRSYHLLSARLGPQVIIPPHFCHLHVFLGTIHNSSTSSAFCTHFLYFAEFAFGNVMRPRWVLSAMQRNVSTTQCRHKPPKSADDLPTSSLEHSMEVRDSWILMH